MLGFPLTPSFINEAEVQKHFHEFARKIRCKWCFRNERQDIASEFSTFKYKSTWNLPKGTPAFELFLRKKMYTEKINYCVFRSPFTQGEPYLKDTGGFLGKLKAVGEIPKVAFLVTADVVGPFPIIPHDRGLELLWTQYDKFKNKVVLIEKIKII